ncbi:hypothetical protein ABH963_000081 [Bacillus sp. RC55]|uniref:hypothetical protein n=1 Tax=Bacillus TaxID=1386 RepID=UPI003833F204
MFKQEINNEKEIVFTFDNDDIVHTNTYIDNATAYFEKGCEIKTDETINGLRTITLYMPQKVFVKQIDMKTGKCMYYPMNHITTGELLSAEAILNYLDWCIDIDVFQEDERKLKYSLVNYKGTPQECIKCGCESYEDGPLCMPCDLEVTANV